MAAIALLVIASTGFFAPGAHAATALYTTDFSPPQTTLSPLSFPNGTTEFSRDITGINEATGGQQAIIPFNGLRSFDQLIVGAPVTVSTIGNYMESKIQQVTGPNGTPVYALYQGIKTNTAPQGTGAQNTLTIYRGENPNMADTGDFYYTYWFKYQPDLADKLIQSQGNWRLLSQFKTVEVNGISDYRISTYVYKNSSTGQLYWHVQGDGVNPQGTANLIHWQVNNTTVPVPVGAWFKYEVFVHRAASNNSSTGRFWAAINGRVIADYSDGPKSTNGHNDGSGGLRGPYVLPINRIMLANNYSGGPATAASPLYQWLTGLEIWDGFPCGVGKSCAKPAPVGPTGYTFCANESQTYTLSSLSDVAYGANGSFYYLYGLTGSVSFDNTTFGGDPLPNVSKSGFCKVR